MIQKTSTSSPSHGEPGTGRRCGYSWLPARSSISNTANRNALTALVRSIDLSVDARKPLTDAQIATIAAWRTDRDDATTRVFREEARRLARAVLEQTEVLRENHRQLGQLTEALAPGLQAVPGSEP